MAPKASINPLILLMEINMEPVPSPICMVVQEVVLPLPQGVVPVVVPFLWRQMETELLRL